MKNNRMAVSAFFFVNGFLHANWTARLPELQRFLGLSHASLGTLLFTAAVGALFAMPLTGWLTTRTGSEKIARAGGLLFSATVPFMAFFPNLSVAVLVFLMMGFFNGALNVTMNAQAVLVERALGKTIMSSFHALFSVGMAIGAGFGALFARMEVTLFYHLLFVSGLSLAGLAIASRFLVREMPAPRPTGQPGGFRLPSKAILPLGLIAFCSMTGEGAMSDWSALYMNKVVGQSEAFSALAFGVFGLAMTSGRIFGDYFTARFGKSNLLVFDSLLALLGLGLVLFFATPWLSLLGFFLVGLGLATVVPIIYSTAGNTEGVSPSAGIAMATTVGYAGFFVGPPAIGFLADSMGLRFGLGLAFLLFVLMLALVWAMSGKSSRMGVPFMPSLSGSADK